MRKLLTLLLALLLALCGAAAEDEELSMEEILDGVAPQVVDKTIPKPPTPEEIAAAEEASRFEPDGSLLITVSAAGDMLLGGEFYGAELEKYAGDHSFVMRNIRETLLEDDLTILSLERATEETAAVLAPGGVEAVTLANDTMRETGEEEQMTLRLAIESAGTTAVAAGEIALREVKGMQVAMLSFDCTNGYDKLWAKVPQDVAAAKTQYPIVIVSFHWGRENSYTPDGDQVQLGRLAVDAGADLVVGSHSRRIQPIECYKGVYICYSLGNFCYTAEEKPSDMSSFIAQMRFRVRDGVVAHDSFRLVPIRISSRTDRNDFSPSLMDKVTSVDSILTTLKENGRNLEFALEDYPLAW